MKSFVIKRGSIALLAAAMAVCSLNAAAVDAAKSAELALNNDDWYQVWSENQAVVFDDRAVYLDYLKTGKAPYLKDLGTKDNAGRALVLGLRAEDKGKDLNTLSAKRFLDVSLPPSSSFYGEIREDNKIFIFQRYGDMMDVVKLGEPIFSYIELGGGPNGERLVYALAKEEKKPETLISKFKSLNR
ncbi:MAG: hypothetical protein Q8R10_17270 [Pseudomonas sp.]|uniref:hypothetical protein n=1 Tax=Pseudomonas sp. TaxID=306 RepID=UPI00273605D6|nr:hypothetical protein [Pseudomonas sp.]MDP3848168.1 hypothetical protein [Pseudomonas sp.]